MDLEGKMRDCFPQYQEKIYLLMKIFFFSLFFSGPKYICTGLHDLALLLSATFFPRSLQSLFSASPLLSTTTEDKCKFSSVADHLTVNDSFT